MTKMSEIIDKLGRLRAEVSFLLKAVVAIDTLPENPLNDEESRGLELLFNVICKDLEDLPVPIQRSFKSEVNEKVWFNLIEN